MKSHIAAMITLLPEEFDSALIGYAESGTGRAMILPVYDVYKLHVLTDHSKKYTMERLAEWSGMEDSPLLLKRMSKEQVDEQNVLYNFKTYTACPEAVLGIVGTWEREECLLYSMDIATGSDESKQRSILNFDLPGRDMCFLMGTSDEDLELIKKKADRYKY